MFADSFEVGHPTLYHPLDAGSGRAKVITAQGLMALVMVTTANAVFIAGVPGLNSGLWRCATNVDGVDRSLGSPWRSLPSPVVPQRLGHLMSLRHELLRAGGLLRIDKDGCLHCHVPMRRPGSSPSSVAVSHDGGETWIPVTT